MQPILKLRASVSYHRAARRIYRLEDSIHRTSGPAIEWTDGSRFWCTNNRFHRDDGPAIELANGSKEWYQDGLLHSTRGPAVTHLDNRGNRDDRYYIKGIRLYFDGWIEAAGLTKKEKTYQRLKHG